MCDSFSSSTLTVAIAVGCVALSASIMAARTQAPAAMPIQALTTPWGDPDLQGIWTDETDTPLQRAVRFGNQEFLTEEQRAEMDRVRGDMQGRERRAERGTLNDVSGAYNDIFTPRKRTGARTSRIVDPPNGRLPPLTPEAAKAAADDRAFRLALLQATDSCKSKGPACRGGNYDPTPSPRFAEATPRYNTANMNRYDGPEDAGLGARCLTGGLPEFGTLGVVADRFSFRRIVQTPGGGISMFYDVGQGGQWQRNIVMDGSPHLPAAIRQWFGDSRGRFEGNTLVIDVTNFSPKTNFMGSRETLHVIERWTRTSLDTVEYIVTVEDPTVWTQPWTAKQEFTRQNEQENRFYTEPRCIEGNFGLPGILHGHRMQDVTFAEGHGPDPRTMSTVTVNESEPDPLQ